MMSSIMSMIVLTLLWQSVVSGLAPKPSFSCFDKSVVKFRFVCNGHKDCDDGRDERFCPDHITSENSTFPPCDDSGQTSGNETTCTSTCPTGFVCYGDAVVASDVITTNITSFDIFPTTTKFLNLSGTDLSSIQTPHFLPGLVELHLKSCRLQHLKFLFTKYWTSNYLYKLDLSYNNIQTLQNIGDVSIFRNLQFLNLSRNPTLKTLSYFSVRSEKLRSLDLSYTSVSVLKLNVFAHAYKLLTYLNLKSTNIQQFFFLQKITQLKHLNIQSIHFNDSDVIPQLRHLQITDAFHTDRPHLCCPLVVGSGIPKRVCHAPRDGISSCEDLLDDNVKRSFLWLFTILSLGGNIAILLYRFSYDRSFFQNKYGLLVTNLGVADFLMGLYLLVISSADVHFRNTYILAQEDWRHSAPCGAAGFAATLSGEASLIFISLITLERILVLKYQDGGHFFTKFVATGTIVTAWVLGITLALIPNLYPEWMVYSSNGACLGLPLATSLQPAGRYSIAVFLVFNAVLFSFIVLGQVAILYLFVCGTIRHTRIVRSAARGRQERNVVLQLTLVVISNLLCWLPICVLGIVSMSGNVVSPDWYARLLLFFTPINASINPIIYSASAICEKIRAPARNTRGVVLEMH